MSPSDSSSPLRLCSPKQTKRLISYFKSGLFISQAKNISQFFVYKNQAKMIKIPVLMIIFSRSHFILLKPLLLKFKVYLF